MESRNVITQPREINDRTFEDIAFVEKTGMNVIANNRYISI